MKNRSNPAEVEVFKDFVATLSNLQKQFDEDYKNGRYLRDRFLTSIDIPLIQDLLRDRIPRTAQMIIQRTVRILSHRPKSARTLVAHVVGSEKDSTGAEEEGITHSCYSLGQKYSDRAQRPMKTHGTGPFRNRNGRICRRYISS